MQGTLLIFYLICLLGIITDGPARVSKTLATINTGILILTFLASLYFLSKDFTWGFFIWTVVIMLPCTIFIIIHLNDND